MNDLNQTYFHNNGGHPQGQINYINPVSYIQPMTRGEVFPQSQTQEVNLGGIKLNVENDPSAKLTDAEMMKYMGKWLGDGSTLQNYVDYLNLATKMVEVMADKHRMKTGQKYSPIMKKEICEALSKRLVTRMFVGRDDPSSIAERDNILNLITASSDTIDIIVYLSKTEYVADAIDWLEDKVEDVGEYFEEKGCWPFKKKKIIKVNKPLRSRVVRR
jgi:hypothetical protein